VVAEYEARCGHRHQQHRRSNECERPDTRQSTRDAEYFDDRETFQPYAHLAVREYESAPEGSLVEHHANLIKVRVGGRDQDTLLVKLHHPSAHLKVKRNAHWLLKQRGFRRLAQMA
jgi:hypothetical protein